MVYIGLYIIPPSVMVIYMYRQAYKPLYIPQYVGLYICIGIYPLIYMYLITQAYRHGEFH